MTLLPSSFLPPLQPGAQQVQAVVLMLAREDQQLHRSLQNSQAVLDPEGSSQRSAGQKTWTTLSAMRRWLPQMEVVSAETETPQVLISTDMGLGYGINYPIRHGQIENWVSPRERSAPVMNQPTDTHPRTTWNVSGRTPSSNTCASNLRTTTFFSQSHL
jgi:hypothetical protein